MAKTATKEKNKRGSKGRFEFYGNVYSTQDIADFFGIPCYLVHDRKRAGVFLPMIFRDYKDVDLGLKLSAAQKKGVISAFDKVWPEQKGSYKRQADEVREYLKQWVIDHVTRYYAIFAALEEDKKAKVPLDDHERQKGFVALRRLEETKLKRSGGRFCLGDVIKELDQALGYETIKIKPLKTPPVTLIQK